MVDQKKLTITLAVKIADLSEEKQKEVLNYINQDTALMMSKLSVLEK